MYGTSLDEVHAVGSLVPQSDPPVAGVRGFGYQHDGADGTIEQFLTAFVFIQTTVPVDFAGIDNIPPNPYGIPFFANPADPLDPSAGLSLQGLELRQEISSFVLAFDTNLFPIVGQQLTLNGANAPASAARIALLEAQATAGQADLIVRATSSAVTPGSSSRTVRSSPTTPGAARSRPRSSWRSSPTAVAARSRSRPSPRAPGGARASIATATGTPTATESPPGAIRRIRTASPDDFSFWG